MTSCGALPASVEGTSAGAPEEHRCVRCGTAYLPFRRGVPCPSCGVPSTSESGIVPAVLDAYARNLRDTGRPIPLTIQVATLWDDYLYRGLFFLKAVDGRRPRESEGSVIARMVEIPNGLNGGAWRAHVADFYRELLHVRRRSAERTK
ncbi:MAG: hypothetical protein A3K59_03550 [Euryarchaeota archaeon RBG_19FT_COMBO_69_17]|uniref:Uncharacterized protein n=2 Tax=environmental samples TaxID=68359 RepID=A0A0H4T5M0_9EURY|nr:hypothetical protein [uncultured euryarchaeote Rifle_16ft_4_minimus_23719]AKQ02748.1 hypothetical protein [uncultured euryarchaeote Rifle_16ft_4_minimus_37664]OGS62108.1 MAG: hypothetical protein A3K59_03550 [Euryarchaeota archaeon RBG_19FT_COMBO_69_17]